MKKIWFGIPMLLVLVAIVCYGVFLQKNSSPPVLSFRIGNADSAQTVSAWHDGAETYYVFLPSYAVIRDVAAIVDPGCRVEIDGAVLTGETDLSELAAGEPHDIRITRRSKATEGRICFLQSANVATMYVVTASGSMDHIHADKDNKEFVRVVMLDESGTVSYSGSNDRLQGHGQYSWLRDKKPYLLTLAHAHGMLGMAPAEKWMLLSNSEDATNLKNKIIYDLAGETGLEGTPKCRYVDLYLNGNYAGLYLLAEKVEVGAQRLDLKTTTVEGHVSFLCKNELHERWASLSNPFLTDSGRTVEIVSPTVLTASQKEQITHDVQMMEDLILSGDVQDPAPYIDVDSWVRKYLIDEIFANIDADLASSFFYCEYSEGRPVFHAGPIWDYDMTFGDSFRRNDNPRAFYANTAFESPIWATPYYCSLYRKDSFRDRMVEIYKDELLPLVTELESAGIERLAAFIARASGMNRVRWFAGGEDDGGKQMIGFLSERIAFLNDAWLNGTQYCSVQIEPAAGKQFLSYAVRTGERIPALPAAVTDSLADPVWYDRDTGEIFDFDLPVTKDTILLLKNDGENGSGKEPAAPPEVTFTGSPLEYVSLHKVKLFVLASVGLSRVLLLAFLWWDHRRNRVKR